MANRRYPCEAVVKEGTYDFEEKELSGVTITVLEEEKYHGCCCTRGHKVEFPEGFPEPPAHCATWICKSEYLIFPED